MEERAGERILPSKTSRIEPLNLRVQGEEALKICHAFEN